MSNTLVMLAGGHSTLVKGFSPGELESIISEHHSDRFVYIQNTQHGDNGLILEPASVVALVAA